MLSKKEIKIYKRDYLLRKKLSSGTKIKIEIVDDRLRVKRTKGVYCFNITKTISQLLLDSYFDITVGPTISRKDKYTYKMHYIRNLTFYGWLF